MKNVLVEALSQFTKLSDEEALDIEESFPMKTFEKGTYLLKEGQIAKNTYLVIQGCLRKYSIANGEEITSDFFIEEQSVADFKSLTNQSPSKYYIVCSERTTVAVMNAEKENALYRRFPRFGAICRVEFEKIAGEREDRLTTFFNSSPEERYLQLLQERPSLLNRVPQYQIASYLGIKPETLSRIRKRIISK